MATIERLGRYHPVSAEGELINDCSAPAPPWVQAVDAMRERAERFFGANISGQYLRGSVARGLAIPYVSDLDYVVLTDVKIARDLVRRWVVHCESQFAIEFPFCRRLDVLSLYEGKLFDPVVGVSDRFTLKTMSYHLAGRDVRDRMEPFRIGRGVAFTCQQLDTDVSRFLRLYPASEESGQMALICWIMRKILRAAGECAMIDGAGYTRDLYLCWEAYSHAALPNASELRRALELAVNPTRVADVAETVSLLAGAISRQFDKSQVK